MRSSVRVVRVPSRDVPAPFRCASRGRGSPIYRHFQAAGVAVRAQFRGGPRGCPGGVRHPWNGFCEAGRGSGGARADPGARREPRARGRGLQPRQREAGRHRGETFGRTSWRFVSRGRTSGTLRRCSPSASFAMYTSGGEDTNLEVLLGASSLDDLMSRIDTVNRVSDQSTEVLKQVKIFRAAVQTREARLKNAHVQQEKLVAERSAQKASIEGQLAQRRQLLSSIKSEIGRIQAAERAAAGPAGGAGQSPALDRRRRCAQRKRRGDHESLRPCLRSAARAIRWRRRDRDAVPRNPVRLRRGEPRRASTARASSCTSSLKSASHFRTTRPPSTDTACPSRAISFRPATSSSSTGWGTTGSTSAAASFIHSPHTGDVVKISSLSGWYSSTWVGARRL